jgi:hypothetical protein
MSFNFRFSLSGDAVQDQRVEAVFGQTRARKVIHRIIPVPTFNQINSMCYIILDLKLCNRSL